MSRSNRCLWLALLGALLLLAGSGPGVSGFSSSVGEATRAASLDSVVAGHLGEAVVPGAAQVERARTDQRGIRVKSLILALALVVARFTERGRRHRLPSPAQRRPLVALRAHTAPRRGPPLLQLV